MISVDKLDENTREEVKEKAETQKRDERIKKQEEHYFENPVFEEDTYKDKSFDKDRKANHKQVAKDKENIDYLKNNPEKYIEESREGAMFSPIQIAEDTVERIIDTQGRDEGSSVFYRARDQYEEENDVSRDKAEEKIKEMMKSDDHEDFNEAMEYAIRGRANLIQRSLENADDIAAISRDDIPDEYLEKKSEEGNEIKVRGDTFYVSQEDL